MIVSPFESWHAGAHGPSPSCTVRPNTQHTAWGSQRTVSTRSACGQHTAWCPQTSQMLHMVFGGQGFLALAALRTPEPLRARSGRDQAWQLESTTNFHAHARTKRETETETEREGGLWTGGKVTKYVVHVAVGCVRHSGPVRPLPATATCHTMVLQVGFLTRCASPCARIGKQGTVIYAPLNMFPRRRTACPLLTRKFAQCGRSSKKEMWGMTTQFTDGG